MKYLKEIINELPCNCLFDKVMVGCGGTSLAIEGDKPYVIAVPYVSMVSNKVRQYPNERYPHGVFGVMDGVTVASVMEYLSKSISPRIITTYDSLHKVVEALGERISEMNLLVDEFHLLFRQYSFRESAVRFVLDNFKRFASFTFMTATPLEDSYILDELQNIPIVVQGWPEEDLFTVKVKAVQCVDVISSAVKIIKRFLEGVESGNLYIFVNSVFIINELVSNANLTKDNCRVIYSKHNSKVVNYKKDGVKITIPNSTVDDQSKKINLLTSTVFEGCDIFDPEGKTVILSDSSAKYSMIDISTSIMQIAGRIRDSKYKGKILHLYKESKYLDCSDEEFNLFVDKQIELAERVISDVESLPDESVKAVLRTSSDCRYVSWVENKLVYDPNLPKLDRFNRKVMTDYTSRITIAKEYANQNATVVLAEDDSVFIHTSRLNYGAGINMHFKNLVKEARDAKDPDRSALIREAAMYYSFLPLAIEKLGFQRIESLGYSQKKIKDELLMLEDSTCDEKVFKMLNYKTGEFRSDKAIKRDLANTYKSLGYKRGAKATDIKKYYHVERKRMTLKSSGKRAWGYLLIMPKF